MFDSSHSWSVGFQLGTPCFWEEVSILVQLAVLGSILIRFMKKRCAHGSRIIEEGVGKYPSSIRLGFIYKSVVVCSVLIAGIHILMLWMILNGYKTLCKSKVSVLSKEILSEISWIITLLLVLNLRHSRSLKLPRVLRVWWIFSFIISIVHTTLYTSYIHTNHRSLTIVYYANIVSLISSTYLGGISINGATGISFITNSTTESLLNKLENHSDGKRENQKESPYQRATLLQLITFSWLSPLFKVGYKKPLEQEDVPGIHIKDSAEILSHSFNNILKQVKETKNTSSPSLYMAIFLFIRKKAAINALFAVINAGASYVGPYLINDFVAFLSQKKNYSLKTGYIIVLAFVSAKMVEVIADRQWVFGARQLGMNLKGVLITHIYKKGLHLSSQSRQSRNNGEMINLMSVDIQRITEFIWFSRNINGDAGKVLSALATFRMLQDSMFTLPDSLSVIAQAKVSVDRIEAYLQEDEIQDDAVSFVPKTSEVGIEIENGTFSWDVKSHSPTLNGIQLKVKRGMKVAICGTVGSGKSSLLSCILGEIPKTSGEECLMGILKKKTIIYVTNQIEFLPAADLTLMMQEGKIIQAGRFEELLKQNIGFELLVGAHSKALKTILNVENSSTTLKKVHASVENDIHTTINEQLPNGKKDNLSQEIIEKGGRLTQKEERENGSIGKEVYWTYLTMVWGGALVPVIILAQISFDALQMWSNYWIAWASPVTTNSKPAVEMNIMFLVYLLIGLASAICILSRQLLVATAGIQTSQKLFMSMLYSVFRAPMSFFDSTPTGRILSRASTDQSVLDLELAKRIGSCAFSISRLLGTVALMSQVAWQVFAIFIPVMGICIWYQQYYTPTARELARLSGIQKAPILHHFAESLAGVATIRAYNQENRFIEMNLRLIDNQSRPWFHNEAAIEWLSFRLNILSNLVFAFSLVILVSLPEGILNPSIAGLAVTYGLHLNILQACVIWHLCNAQNKMISVERILQYSKLTSEAPSVIEECRPPSNWPEFGKICFKNLEALHKCQLGNLVRTKEGKLDSTVADNGENWSVGQRQLFCLGRALLKKSSILVLDEATASIDSATDGIIQKIISQEFENRTVVTIAHRIHTIIDSDLVLVLSEGRIAEYDMPAKLLEREDSFFSKLIKEYSMRSKGSSTA
ncbi:hypothetical protein MKW92_000230 [Papaver armeniacum]|nr:hypothetical protein MKW92_000230 [Papaver armeniacum]